MIAGTSPPGPLRWGSTTCRVKAVAMPASKALPPFSSVAIPTAVAIQWVEATTPKVPSISGRVVNGLGLMFFMGISAAPGERMMVALFRSRGLASRHSGVKQHAVERQELIEKIEFAD